ncbi:MAG: 3,4-dihydroxyphenylacetate 2,3-dioxygenase [Alphaproteobacteria bacterium]|nr:3,4-dihydroxyphenylacetate 2,3-dioxygenase [Alphaproteobacteria bacterium]
MSNPTLSDPFPANLNPPFNVTRASHAVLTARDLDATQAFYCDVLGLILSRRDRDALYLRGLEERSHHSLVFLKSDKPPVCERVGLRVFTEDDLDRAAAHFGKIGHHAVFVERPYQGRTLHVDDAIGTPLELCATMDDLPTNLQRFELYKGASPMRLDHFQIAAHDVQTATDFYLALGFRLTEFTATDGKDEIWASWLQRKGNPHDVVFSSGRGPRLHHFAYAVPEARDIIHVCDVAGSLGFGKHFERGPGRHGIGNALFVYFRDPDGHRVELFNAHYQAIDINHTPLRWDLSNTRRSQLWGLPAQARWFYEASEFAGRAPQEPLLKADPVTLEKFLAQQF